MKEKDYRKKGDLLTTCTCNGTPEKDTVCIHNKKGRKSTGKDSCFHYREDLKHCNNFDKK